MKPLRKIFFWDEPAQGALFGLTLLLTSAWGIICIFSCITAYSRTWFHTAISETFQFRVTRWTGIDRRTSQPDGLSDENTLHTRQFCATRLKCAIDGVD